MFMGRANNSIDEKNRMIIPSRMRAELGARCVLTRSLDTCLNIYTVTAWEQQMEKISRLPESDPKVRAFIRHICGNAVECELDKQGRIIIPQDLKEYAEIDRDLVTIGAMTKIEVWSRSTWEAPDNDSKMDKKEFSDALKAYSY